MRYKVNRGLDKYDDYELLIEVASKVTKTRTEISNDIMVLVFTIIGFAIVIKKCINILDELFNDNI